MTRKSSHPSQNDGQSRLEHDLDRTMQGLLALATYVKANGDVAVSLSQFMVQGRDGESTLVRQGEVAEYVFKLINNTQEHLWLGLLVDIYARNNQVHPEGHHAYFRKDILVPSRSSQPLAFRYNWLDSAAFVLDGFSFAPDSSWHGPCDAPGDYLVWARLYNQGLEFKDGELVEELPLLQRLVV